MAQILNDVVPDTILNTAALNAVSNVFAWGHLEQAAFAVTAGAGTVAIETALTESGPWKQLSTFTDAVPSPQITTNGNIFRLKVTVGGPVTVIGQGYQRGQ